MTYPHQSLNLTGLVHLVIVFAFLVISGPNPLSAQVSSASLPPASQPTPLPITTQIKKTIVFLETDCLHDFSKDAINLTRDKISQMPRVQQQSILNGLRMLSVRMRAFKPGMNKLSAQEAAQMSSQSSIANPSSDEILDEIEWRLQAIIKMTALTDGEIASLTQGDLAIIPADQSRGTGFLVGYGDVRLKAQPGDLGPRYFRYLVTNRHVVQPGIQNGTPCKVVSSYILVNHRPDATHTSDYAESDRIDKIFKWVTPEDDSVDLAVTGIGFDDKQFDHMVIPTNQFLTEEDSKDRRVVEGDPVLFAGLFVQTFDQVHTLEPIVRSGTVAMIPEGMLHTTVNNKLGHIYLADAHVFGGNSGSPMFVDPNKFAGVISAPTYKLLGVISGEVFENSDMSLSVATSVSGEIAANSDVSIVVPATELMKLLNRPELQANRDRQIKSQSDSASPPPQ